MRAGEGKGAVEGKQRPRPVVGPAPRQTHPDDVAFICHMGFVLAHFAIEKSVAKKGLRVGTD